MHQCGIGSAGEVWQRVETHDQNCESKSEKQDRQFEGRKLFDDPFANNCKNKNIC